uniref:Uncharacterized protein n=1 Tax=Salix viminalis TaxID=40686 RepID=A0A6N2N7X7_SALVM
MNLESEPSDHKDDHHINKVEVKKGNKKVKEDRYDELIESLNQYMVSPTLEFEVVNRDDRYKYNK